MIILDTPDALRALAEIVELHARLRARFAAFVAASAAVLGGARAVDGVLVRAEDGELVAESMGHRIVVSMDVDPQRQCGLILADVTSAKGTTARIAELDFDVAGRVDGTSLDLTRPDDVVALALSIVAEAMQYRRTEGPRMVGGGLPRTTLPAAA